LGKVFAGALDMAGRIRILSDVDAAAPPSWRAGQGKTAQEAGGENGAPAFRRGVAGAMARILAAGPFRSACQISGVGMPDAASLSETQEKPHSPVTDVSEPCDTMGDTTECLLRSPANAKRLLESIEEVKQGKTYIGHLSISLTRTSPDGCFVLDWQSLG
jgi:hypothetical protein